MTMTDNGLKRLRAKLMSGSANEQEKIDFCVLAGKNRDERSSKLLHQLTNDSSEDVRYYALRALVLDSIDRSDAAERKCWDLFDHDASSRVRALSAACIGSLRSQSKDAATFSRLKARIGKSEDRIESEAALEALYNVVGRPPREWPTQRRILSGATDQQDIAALLAEASDIEERYLHRG